MKRASEGDSPIFTGRREFHGASRPRQPVFSAVNMRQSPARDQLLGEPCSQDRVFGAAIEREAL